MSRPLGRVQRASSVPTGSAQTGDHGQALGHGLDPLRVQLQPVEHGTRQALGARGRHVAGVGGQDRVDVTAQGRGRGRQGAVLHGARGQRQLGGSRPGGPAQGQHLAFQRIREHGRHHTSSSNL